MENPETQQDVSVSQKIRMMFYEMKPNESSFQTLEEVPDYYQEATPVFISLILLELAVSWISKGKKPQTHIDDILGSLSAGALSRLPSLFFRSFEVTSYVYIWENYRLINLPWDLSYLGYYWFHRMAHEMFQIFFLTQQAACITENGGCFVLILMARFKLCVLRRLILYGLHTKHTTVLSTELSTALRQPVFQAYTSWIFYSSLAFFIPPSVYAVHLQFNLLYQFWIHTELVDNLGPLELILNIPSHRRVHHGRNCYCIDKNYVGTLIIQDKIFGTFEAENKKVVYGLTYPINTFDPIKVQFHYLVYIWTMFWATPGFFNKFSVIFKGPGWCPGKPRLGLNEEIPEVAGKEVPFSSSSSYPLKINTVVQFALLIFFYEETFADKYVVTQVTLRLRAGIIILTLTSIGFILDQRPQAAVVEISRCLVVLTLYRFGPLKPLSPSLSFALEIFFSICIAFWGVRTMKELVSGLWKY